MLCPDRLLCLKPWENSIVYANGDIKFCCFMSVALGNFNYATFNDIWNGNTAKRIRKQILNRKIPQECSNCPLIHEYSSIASKEK